MADTLFGRSLREARRVFRSQLTSFPVNSTLTVMAMAVPTGYGRFRVESVYWVASASLSDADGTLLVSVINKDKSEGADDTLVSAQSVEAGTANEPANFTLETETSEKEFTLDEGDAVRVTFTNNSAAIDTNGAITVFVSGFWLPEPYESGPGVKHTSSYL